MTRELSAATARIYTDSVNPGLSESNAEQWNFWGNTATLQAYFCTNPTAGIQTWERILFNASTASLALTLTADLAGATFDINNITDYVGINGASTIKTGAANTNTLAIQAYDGDAAGYVTFITLTAADTPTCDLDDAVTKAGGYIYRAGGTDVPVSDGGTGASSLTDHGVLVGSGTSAIDALAVGATGTVLIGTTGADPSFSANPAVSSLTTGSTTSDVTFTINGTSTSSTLANHAEGASDLAEVVNHRHTDTAGFGAFAFFLRTRGTEATETVVQSGDTLGTVYFGGYDGTDYALASSITCAVDGTPGANDMPGRIIFSTSADGSQTPTEALRINSSQVATFAAAPIFSTLTGILTANGASALSVSTVTQNGVLYGGASNAVSSLAVAATGTVLIGNTAAAPSFSASPAVTSVAIGSGGLTITSGSGAPGSSQPKGSLYLRSDGSGVNDRMYVATDAVGGWTAVVTVA